MKIETLKKLYESALKRAEEEKQLHNYDEVEVVLVPIVVCKSNGKIGTVTGVETSIIFEENSNR